jgi:preprotein translocase subunit SecG
MLTLTLLFSFQIVAYYALWFLMIVSMLLLIAVILLQEGKGGGLAEAFGGAGAETFGVKAHGINKFTAVVGGLFLLLCIVLNKFHVRGESAQLLPGYTPPPKDQTQGNPDAAQIQQMIEQMKKEQGGDNPPPTDDGGGPPPAAPPAAPPAGGNNPPPPGDGN